MFGSISINANRTALILVDLQKGVLNMQPAPHASSKVLSNAVRLAEAFRKQNGLVVLIHVGFSADGKDALQVPTDTTFPGGDRPDDWTKIAPELGPQKGDIVIKKHQWGGFYGTGLDLQLRRRGIDTLVMGGIATNFGVESTARDAFERNYSQIFAEDAMSSISEEAHHFAIKNILSRMGRVRSTDDVMSSM